MGETHRRPEIINSVRTHRRSRGMRQQELADAAGVSLRTITNLENRADYVPSLAVALRVARALGLGVERLFAISPTDH